MKPIRFPGSSKPFTYGIWGLMFLFLAISVNTNGYAHLNDETAKAFPAYKKDARPRMFLIAVADTDDDSIGERCAVDLDQVTGAFEDIADWIDAEMAEPEIISGSLFGKAAVTDAIDNWLRSRQPTRRDIVVFYYTGHGFRYSTDASRYPRMWLKTASDKNIENNNLQVEADVYNRIVKMGAGLNIIISDCCNNRVAGDDGNFDNVAVPTRQRQKHKREHPNDNSVNDDDDTDYGDKLFLADHPVSMLVTAADKDELAGGTSDAGGFFTRYLLDALDKCIYDNSIQPSWKNIFDSADDQAGYWARSANCPATKHTEQGRCVQDAVVKIAGSN